MSIVCGQIDISKFSDDEIVAASGYGAWVKFDVDEKIYEINNQPFGYAVIKFSNPCLTTPCAEDSTNLVNNCFLMIATALNTTNSEYALKNGNENADVSSPHDLPGSGQQASLVCGVDVNLLRKMQSTVDSLQLNEKGFFPSAIRPNAALIPLKSNVFSYGPWASSNFSTTYGGTEIITNPDLSPWNFGSISYLNGAGVELANTSIVGLSRAEKGSVSVLGLPQYTIGAALGVATSPNLTNISVNFGSGGLTTTYDYATYTPKFGQLSRAVIEKYKNIVKIRNEQLKFLRQSLVMMNKINQKRFSNAYNAQPNKGELSKSLSDKNSLSRVFIGEIFDYQATASGGIGQRTICGVSSLSKSVLEMRDNSYTNKAFMSIDGFYGPVSISGGYPTNRPLPRFIQTTTYEGCPSNLAWTISPQPPFSKNGNITSLNNATLINSQSEIVEIKKEYLNPLANPGSIPHHNGNVGHCIDMVGRGAQLTNNGLITNFYQKDAVDKYSQDYRFLAMRGPLVLHGWGYDTDGKPVPNAADCEEDTKIGIFKPENLKDEFMSDWLQKPSTWPVAPVDLRLDRERGVWVAPREHRLVVVEILEDIPGYGKGAGKLITNNQYGKKLQDSDGQDVNDNNTRIVVEDRIGSYYPTGSIGYAYFDTFTSTYLLLTNSLGKYLMGETAGLWYKNTSKAVQLKMPKIENGVMIFENVGDPIIAHNYMQHTGQGDTTYKVLLTVVNGIIFYVNGGSCTT